MPVTLKDIAKKLGLSTSTVSLALKPKEAKRYRLAPKTVKLVNATAQKMGYRPNRLAASLRNSRTHIIGVLVSQLDFCIGEVLDDIIQEVFPDFTPLLTAHNWQGAVERRELETLLDKRVDGIIAAFSGDQKSKATYRKVAEDYGIPVVLMGRKIPGLDLKVVRSDHYKVAYETTRTLQNSGYRQIHFLSPRISSQLLEASTLREQGYSDAMRQADIKEEITIHEAPDVWSQQNLRKFANNVLDSWQKNQSKDTVLFAENDLLAYELLDQCDIRRIKVPADLSIMGIGDYPLSSRRFIELSTVSEERNGRKAAQVLLKMMRGQSCKEKTFLVPANIILRKTTRNT